VARREPAWRQVLRGPPRSWHPPACHFQAMRVSNEELFDKAGIVFATDVLSAPFRLKPFPPTQFHRTVLMTQTNT
jgi:hypothetical protein